MIQRFTIEEIWDWEDGEYMLYEDYEKVEVELLYWKQRCKAVEDRMDALENEIYRLKGYKRIDGKPY